MVTSGHPHAPPPPPPPPAFPPHVVYAPRGHPLDRARGRGGYAPRRQTGHRAPPMPPGVVVIPNGSGTDESEPAPLEPKDMKMEVKRLESRFSKDGYLQLEEAGNAPPAKDHNDRWREWALCVTRHFDRNGGYTHSTLAIKSPLMKDILKRVIGECNNVSFKTERIELTLPAKVLFYYLDELEDERDSLEEGSLERQHLEFLLDFLHDEFEDTIKELENLTPEGLISYPTLWTQFKPGCIIYMTTDGRPRAATLTEGTYICATQNSPAQYRLNCKFIECDGNDFGWSMLCVSIIAFPGSKKVTKLEAFPFEMHPDKGNVRKDLIVRGQKFVSLRGREYRQYTGLTLGEYTMTSRVKYNINGPIMVDCETYCRLNTNMIVSIDTSLFPETEDPFSDLAKRPNPYDYDYGSDPSSPVVSSRTKKESPDTLPDDLLLQAATTCHGFAFAEKKWVEFFIDLVAPAQWNDAAFDQLVLPAQQKSLIRALVESHSAHADDEGGFDDFIKGKGRGLVAILHGPPGVGKTLTAEAVSQAVKRPLYAVSSGELGTTAQELEAKLARILDVATVWKAVLLLDEADVFLEQRATHDLQRNALVSIFLRLLEYYQGILLLTTNRVRTFDQAFQSRIHIALKYNDLDFEARRSVWRNFLKNMDGCEVGEDGYSRLAEHKVGGRVIKNAIRTARSLSEREGSKLGVEQIEMVLGIQREFEVEMAADGCEAYV